MGPLIQPAAFRAGRRPGEQPGQLSWSSALSAGPVTYLADVSEFQPDIADAAYLAWSKAIVIRAAYGDQHDDGAWYGGARRAGLHAGGAQFIGIYQYLSAGQDAAAQARELAALVGVMQPGEKIICDLEEGGGDQVFRWQAWAQVIRDELGDDPWDYSGLWFSEAAGIAPVTWVAAYQAAEPSVPHTLWQFTDAYQVPGVGSCDCSLYHGTITQLAALAHGGRPAPASGWTQAMIAELTTLSFGASGEDVKTAQGLLIARGYPVTADGSYGPATRAAMTAFQHAGGLTPDGICGPATWLKLHHRLFRVP